MMIVNFQGRMFKRSVVKCDIFSNIIYYFKLMTVTRQKKTVTNLVDSLLISSHMYKRLSH